MKKFIKNFITHTCILILVVFPVLAFAQGQGLVPCQEGCDFNDFLTLVNTVVDFVLIKMFLPIAAFMFVYAGFTIITAGGNTEKVKQGKKIFWHVVVGFAIAVAAWVIVHTFLAVLGYKDASWIGF